MYLVNSIKALGRGGGPADDGDNGEDQSQETSRGIIEEFEQDSDFMSLPEEDQDRTVSAYERTVERGLLVPLRGLLEPSMSSRSNSSSAPSPSATPATRVMTSWGNEAATLLPPLNVPPLKVLDWSYHVDRLGEALRWCDAYRAEKLVLACADDKRLCGYEPALSTLATALATRVRAVATCDAAFRYAQSCERLATNRKQAASLAAELESLRAVVGIHEEEWRASAGERAARFQHENHGRPMEEDTVLRGSRQQLAHVLGQALEANREGFEACGAARLAVADLAEQLASFVPPPQPDEADDGSGEGSSLGGGNGDLSEGGYVPEEVLLDAMLGLPSAKHMATALAGSNSNKNGNGSASNSSGSSTRLGSGAMAAVAAARSGTRRGSLASKQGNSNAATGATSSRRSPMPKVNFASASTLASSLSRAMDAQRQLYREKSNGSAGGGSVGSPTSGGSASSLSPLSPPSLDLDSENATAAAGAASVGFAGGARATPEVAQLLSSVGAVSASCVRLVHVSEANWAALEKILEDAQERCRTDMAALRGKVADLEHTLEMDVAVEMSEWEPVSRRKQVARLRHAYGGGKKEGSLLSKLQGLKARQEADWEPIATALQTSNRLAYNEAVRRSLVSEVAYFEDEQANVAKKLAEVKAQLASHDAADATAASSHEWRLSRTKVSRRAIGRRLQRLEATEATIAVGERCTALLRHVSRWLWRALVARLQALDASLVVALRQSLASFADLASEQGQVLASMEASHRVTLEQQAQDQRKIMADRTAAERGEFGPAGREAVARGDFDARRESALATREVTRQQCAEVQERRQKLLAEAATKAPLFVHASQVAAEAAAAATTAAAAETGAGSSSDGGARHDAASRGGAAAAVSTEAASEEGEFAPPPASNPHALSDPPMPPRPHDKGDGLPEAALQKLSDLLSTSPNLAHHRLAAALLSEYEDSSSSDANSSGDDGNEDRLAQAAKSDPLNLLFFVLPTDADDDPCANLPMIAAHAAARSRSSVAGEAAGGAGTSFENTARARRSVGVDGAGGSSAGAGAGLLGLLGGSGERDERGSEWSFSDAAAPQNKEAAEESEARAAGGNRFNLPKMPNLGQIFESGQFLGPSSSSNGGGNGSSNSSSYSGGSGGDNSSSGRSSVSVDAAGMGGSGGSRAGAYARGREPASQDRPPPPLDDSYGRLPDSCASFAADPSSLSHPPAPSLPASVPVQVPPGAGEGQPMVVTVEGRRFRFMVPMGLSPGSVFQLSLNDATEVVRRMPPSSSSHVAPAPTPPPPPNEDVGADAVAGWLMERGVDPGVAIEACAALVASGLDRASRLGSAEPASLRLAGLSEEAVLAVLGDSSDVRSSLASMAQAHNDSSSIGHNGRGHEEQGQAGMYGAPPEYQELEGGGYGREMSNTGPTAAPGDVNYSSTTGYAYPELGRDEAHNNGQHTTKYPSRQL